MGGTVVDGNHKLRESQKKNSTYVPKILRIETCEDIIAHESELRTIENNKWVTEILKILNEKPTDKDRGIAGTQLGFEEYGDDFDGWNDSSFFTEEMVEKRAEKMSKERRDAELKSLIARAKSDAGAHGWAKL